MDFISFDFETANEKRFSACSLGIAVIKDCEIIEKKHFLIKPPESYFNPFNVRIHGITEGDVKDKPSFDELWPEIKEYFEGKNVVAHNASFDISVLRNVLDEYKIDYPKSQYYCTRVISKKLWPNFISYSLDTLADHFGIQFQHHNALEDALACASLSIKACNEAGVTSLPDLVGKLQIFNGHIYPGGYKPIRQSANSFRVSEIKANTNEFNDSHPLYEKSVVFTGTLESMPRKEAMQNVVDVGGVCVNSINKSTNFLVIGQQDFTKLKGGTKSSKMLKVEKLISQGFDIEIIGEEEFLKMLYS